MPSMLKDQKPAVALDKTGEDYFVCSICYIDVHKLAITPLSLASKQKNAVNQPPTENEFIDEQSNDELCKNAAKVVCMCVFW